MNITVYDCQKAIFAGRELSCLIGKKGVTRDKKEGDLKTPVGFLRPLALFYRAGKVARPFSRLPVIKIHPSDGWCDDVRDKRYNLPVHLPYRARCEKLYRKDHVYDLVLASDYNYPHPRKGKGSAIFIHLQRPDGAGTEGCLAFRYADLKKIIARMTSDNAFEVIPYDERNRRYERLRARLQFRRAETARARRG